MHKVAFRNSLGNSLFCAKHKIGKISSETLQHYVAENYGANRAAIVGLAVKHDELVNYAKNISLPSSKESSTCSDFHGGEMR